MKYIFTPLLLAPFLIFSQLDSNGCLIDKQKVYKCSKVTERILPNALNSQFDFNTRIDVTFKEKLRKKKDQIKAEKVIALMNKVLNDQDFWNGLENYDDYRFAKWSEKVDQPWESISGKEIPNSLINGNPRDSSRPDTIIYPITLELSGLPFATFFESAVGSHGGRAIVNKRWFFRKYSIEAIGANWVHEIAHAKGLRHCYNCDENRDYSVPYVINRLFTEVASKYK